MSTHLLRLGRHSWRTGAAGGDLHQQVTGYARDVFPDLRVDPHRLQACGETVHKWTRRREFLDPRCRTALRLKRQRMVYGHTPKQVYLPEFAPDGGKLNADTGPV